MTTKPLPGNPFATEDALYTEDSNNASVVSALMALAFEQRTATLVAQQQLWLAEGLGPSYSVAEEIDNRLKYDGN